MASRRQAGGRLLCPRPASGWGWRRVSGSASQCDQDCDSLVSLALFSASFGHRRGRRTCVWCWTQQQALSCRVHDFPSRGQPRCWLPLCPHPTQSCRLEVTLPVERLSCGPLRPAAGRPRCPPLPATCPRGRGSGASPRLVDMLVRGGFRSRPRCGRLASGSAE